MSSEREPRHRVRNLSLGTAALITAGVGAEAVIHQSRLHASEAGSRISNIVRDRFGNATAEKIEYQLFAYDDWFVRAGYRVQEMLGMEQKAQAMTPVQLTSAKVPEEKTNFTIENPKKEPPLTFPTIEPLHENLNPDEGYWSTEGLPNPTDKIIMAKAYLYPDLERPYAKVETILVDKRAINLKMTGGKESPGGDRGIYGTGRIPEEDLPNTLLAFNGGWQGTHAPEFGMFADGKEYRPMTDGLATIVSFKDGSFKIGEWGRDFTERTEEMTGIRQNATLLVDNGEISKNISSSVSWGLVNIGDVEHFITWRSAVGITENGDLIIASGDNVNQINMAKSMRAAGARHAILLDNNLPYVQTVIFYNQEDGTKKPKNTRDFMTDPYRFIKGSKYDLLYLTLK